MSSDKNNLKEDYQKVKRIKPEAYRAICEIGWAICCAPSNTNRLTLAAQAEKKAMAIVAHLIKEDYD